MGFKPAADYISFIIVSFACFMLLAILSVRFSPNHFRGFPLLVLFCNAIAIRVIITQFEISDDTNRYVWEGHIQNHGYNPYQFAPEDSSLKHLIWDRFRPPTHESLKTIYSPLALQLFKQTSFYTLSYDVYHYIFLIIDILTMIFLLLLLRLRGDPYKNFAYYALNPVPIVAFAGQGHVDGLMVFWIVLSLLFSQRGSWVLMWCCLALSSLSKFPAICLVLCFLNRLSWPSFGVFFLICGIGYSPYISSDINVFETLSLFGTQFQYNNSIFGLVYFFVGDNFTTLIILLITAGLICGWILLITDEPMVSGLLIGSIFLLFTPTVHYWYLSIVIPFISFYPKDFIKMWCLTSGLWLAVLQSLKIGQFNHYPYLQLIQYIPVYILLFKDFFNISSHQDDSRLKTTLPELSIIIPVLNEGVRLQSILDQLKLQIHPLDEIIVVDGGSKDDSIEVAIRSQVQLVQSQKGRGFQISKGIVIAKNPVILILHADQKIDNTVLAKVRQAMLNETFIGGCVGATFDDLSRGQWIINFLNIFRARCMGMSFGDQGQFFRTSHFRDEEWNLEMPLMEDVELAIQLWNKIGKICYLNGGLTTSVRRWQKISRVRNALQIIMLVIQYCLIRKLYGKVDTRRLYEKYYGTTL